mgnify:CR=1 FL=1
MSKLFEEAIADAKKLKEVAEENAKKAILESVTPQIREFIEEQLLEGEKEGEDEDEDTSENLDEEVYLDEGALASLVNLIGEENLDSLNESKSQKALFSAVKGAVSTMDDNQREKLLNLSHKLDESANKLSSKRGEKMSRKYYEVDLRTLRESLEAEENEGMDVYEDDMEDTDEMAALYEEFSALLEQDEEEAPEMDDMDMEMPEMDDMEGEDMGDDAMLSKDEVAAAVEGLIAELELDIGAGGADMGMEDMDMDMPDMEGMDDMDMEAPEGEEEQLDEVFNVDPRMLRQEINRVKRLVREGKMDHHFGGKGGSKAGVKGAFGGTGNKKAGVKGAFGGGSEGQDVFVNPPQINKLNEAIRQLRRQNRAQSEKLNKYRGAVNSLREQLEDLNLFNAKLLYVNKLLQNKSLNESQKKSVIKALDEAQSLTEAKSLYKSLTETFRSTGRTRSTISESRVLGSSSRATTSSQSSAISSNNELSRWQRLAGL